MSEPYKAGSILLVEWEDSATEAASLNWMGGKDLRDALAEDEGVVKCHTVGFYVFQSRRTLTLCQNISESNQVSHVISIPLSAVLSVEVMHEPQE